MSRTVPSSFLTKLSGSTLEPFYAVDLEFDSPNALYLWTGLGDKTIGGNTYTGAGSLLTVSDAEETNDLTVNGITLTLSGVTSDLVSKALAEPYQNRVCKVHFGVEGDSNLIEVFSGTMDTMVIEDGPETATISLAVEHKLVALERPVVQRYTEESHKAISTANSSDTFFSFLADLQDKTVTWGKKTT